MWQKWLDARGDAAPAFLSIAVDVQGPELPARYVKRHGVTYPVVVDRANVVAGSLLGQRVVPLWTVLDEEGRLVASAAGGASDAAALEVPLAAKTRLRGRAATRAPTVEELDRLVAEKPGDLALRLTLASRLAIAAKTRGAALGVLDASAFEGAAAKAIHVARADVHLRMKDETKALASLRAALALDPEDFLVRKQIWCLEAPERFYEGDVDYGWQRERMAKDRAGHDE